MNVPIIKQIINICIIAYIGDNTINYTFIKWNTEVNKCNYITIQILLLFIGCYIQVYFLLFATRIYINDI